MSQPGWMSKLYEGDVINFPVKHSEPTFAAVQKKLRKVAVGKMSTYVRGGGYPKILRIAEAGPVDEQRERWNGLRDALIRSFGEPTDKQPLSADPMHQVMRQVRPEQKFRDRSETYMWFIPCTNIPDGYTGTGLMFELLALNGGWPINVVFGPASAE